jgi:hypothetical protein
VTEESVHGESVHLYLQSECKQDESVIHSWGRILRFAQNDNLGLFGQPERPDCAAVNRIKPASSGR